MSFSSHYNLSSGMHPAYMSGLTGGAMIGASAATLLLFSGSILGASGISRSILLSPLDTLKDPASHWKLVFLATFFLSSHYLVKSESSSTPYNLSSMSYILAGFFVGLGTRLGNGCTSGHGVCGLARLSKRSFAAVCTFMTSAIATVKLAYNTPALLKYTSSILQDKSAAITTTTDSNAASYITAVIALMALTAPLFYKKSATKNDYAKLAPSAVAGSLFALGLGKSQMIYQSRVLGFLDVSNLSTWDPTLVAVLGGAVVVSFLSYQFVPGFQATSAIKPLKHPIGVSEKFSLPNSTTIDSRLITGAALFGLGWGLNGLCPGPAMVHVGIGTQAVISYWWPAFALGSFVAGQV